MIHYILLALYAVLALACFLLWQKADELARELYLCTKEREAESVRQMLELEAWVRTLPSYARKQAF